MARDIKRFAGLVWSADTIRRQKVAHTQQVHRDNVEHHHRPEGVPTASEEESQVSIAAGCLFGLQKPAQEECFETLWPQHNATCSIG